MRMRFFSPHIIYAAKGLALFTTFSYLNNKSINKFARNFFSEQRPVIKKRWFILVCRTLQIAFSISTRVLLQRLNGFSVSFPVLPSAEQRSQMAKFLALALRGKWSLTEVPAACFNQLFIWKREKLFVSSQFKLNGLRWIIINSMISGQHSITYLP